MHNAALERHELNPIASSFSQAASSYDSAAALQRDIGKQLLAQLPSSHRVQTWIDLGCGTGYFSQQLSQLYPDATGLGLDIAQGMLHRAQRLRPCASYVCGDAQALPLASASQDLIFSNMALQWCSDFSNILAQTKRALTPQGIFAFTSVLDGSLCELKQSWQTVDTEPHINQFRRFTDYQNLCQNSGLQLVCLNEHSFVQHFPSVRALSRNLKQLGAHHIQDGRAQGLTSRQEYTQLRQAYEQYRQAQGLPVTWNILFAVLQAA